MGGRRNGYAVILMAFLAVILVAGCSSDNPTETADTSEKINTLYNSLTETQLQLAGRVASIEYEAQTMTLVELAGTIVADAECYVFTMVEGVETPLTFDDITVGDSVQVCGNYQDEQTFLAKQIRIYGENECPEYDVSFRDTIVAIDYAAGTFTVSGRTETITVDENTLIWGLLGNNNSLGGTDGFTPLDGGTVEESKDQRFTYITYTFTDLEVGDIVEVKAFIVDGTTLLAAVIKVANCTDKKSIAFTTTLATVDCDLRIVTFDGENWICAVCPGAILLDADGAVLTLCELQLGDLFAVKGFPMESDTLKICEMVLQ